MLIRRNEPDGQKIVAFNPAGLPHRSEQSQNDISDLQPGEMRMTQSDLQREIEASYEAGFREGEQSGSQKSYTEIEDRLRNLTQVFESFSSQRQELLRESERVVLELAFSIADKILGSEAVSSIEMPKQKVRELVNRCLNHFSKSAKLVIRANAATSRTLNEYEAELRERLATGTELTVIEDPSLKNHELLFECEAGVLDARLESQLDEIKSSLTSENSDESDG